MEKVYYAIIVLFNKKIEESITIKELEKIKKYSLKFIILDNSTISLNNELMCKRKGYTYISMNGNGGLSKAYNSALNYLNGRLGIYIFLDDDTSINQEYFDELDKNIKYDYDIFAPVIMGQNGKFYSPNQYRKIKNKQLKNPVDEIPNNRFNAINSCTAVKSYVFEKYRFDENLFLDQVDHDFYAYQREINRKFKKLDVIIQQNFSMKTKKKNSKDSLNRYQLMIPDFIYFSKKHGNKFICFLKITYMGIKEMLRYQEIRFPIWLYSLALKSIRRRN